MAAVPEERSAHTSRRLRHLFTPTSTRRYVTLDLNRLRRLGSPSLRRLQLWRGAMGGAVTATLVSSRAHTRSRGSPSQAGRGRDASCSLWDQPRWHDWLGGAISRVYSWWRCDGSLESRPRPHQSAGAPLDSEQCFEESRAQQQYSSLAAP